MLERGITRLNIKPPVAAGIMIRDQKEPHICDLHTKVIKKGWVHLRFRKKSHLWTPLLKWTKIGIMVAGVHHKFNLVRPISLP